MWPAQCSGWWVTFKNRQTGWWNELTSWLSVLEISLTFSLLLTVALTSSCVCCDFNWIYEGKRRSDLSPAECPTVESLWGVVCRIVGWIGLSYFFVPHPSSWFGGGMNLKFYLKKIPCYHGLTVYPTQGLSFEEMARLGKESWEGTGKSGFKSQLCEWVAVKLLVSSSSQLRRDGVKLLYHSGRDGSRM